MNRKIKQLIFFAAGLLASIGFDQWTKYLAVQHLSVKTPYPGIVLWNGVFELYYSENRGAAFGMLQGKQGFFFLIAAAVIAVVAYLLWKMPAERRYLPFTVCLFLLVSGAVGNMLDRLSQGYVVDFLYFKLIDFPIFNVADCYVVSSTFLLLLLFFFYYSDEDLKVFSLKKNAAGEKELNESSSEKMTAEHSSRRESAAKGVSADKTSLAGIAADKTSLAGMAADKVSPAEGAAGKVSPAGVSADKVSPAGVSAGKVSLAEGAADKVSQPLGKERGV